MQNGKVCREDGYHALPDMQLGGRTRLRQYIGVAARIVKQDLVFADVKQHGGQTGEVARQGQAIMTILLQRLICSSISWMPFRWKISALM
jgi:hypothetical protein